MSVVVDSSVWVDFLRGRTVPTLEEALAQGVVILPPLVLAELVSGAQQPQQRAVIEDLLEDLPLHETPPGHWIRVGELRRDLRRQGVSLSIPDAHVAQCALDRDALLLSRDTVFARVARLAPLRVHSG